jgi:hypothetical protein
LVNINEKKIIKIVISNKINFKGKNISRSKSKLFSEILTFLVPNNVALK